MALKDVQKKLKTDVAYRKKFMSDPVGTLKADGVTLDPDAEQQLESGMKKIAAKNPAAADSTAGINGGIGISIHF